MLNGRNRVSWAVAFDFDGTLEAKMAINKPAYNDDIIYHVLMTHYLLLFHLGANSLSSCSLQCHVEALGLMAGMHQNVKPLQWVKRMQPMYFRTSAKLPVGCLQIKLIM